MDRLTLCERAGDFGGWTLTTDGARDLRWLRLDWESCDRTDADRPRLFSLMVEGKDRTEEPRRPNGYASSGAAGGETGMVLSLRRLPLNSDGLLPKMELEEGSGMMAGFVELVATPASFGIQNADWLEKSLGKAAGLSDGTSLVTNSLSCGYCMQPAFTLSALRGPGSPLVATEQVQVSPTTMESNGAMARLRCSNGVWPYPSLVGDAFGTHVS